MPKLGSLHSFDQCFNINPDQKFLFIHICARLKQVLYVLILTLYANHFFLSECYVHCLRTIGMKNLKTKQKYEQKYWRKKNQVQKKRKKKQCESQVFFEPNRQRCVIFFLCALLLFCFCTRFLWIFCAFLFIVASYSLLQFVLHHLCYLLFLSTRWKRVQKKMKKRNFSVYRIDKMLHEYTFNIYLPH